MESDARSLSTWLAEPASVSAENIFAPISSFVTSLERVHADNLLEAAKARRQYLTHCAIAPLRRPSRPRCTAAAAHSTRSFQHASAEPSQLGPTPSHHPIPPPHPTTP